MATTTLVHARVDTPAIRAIVSRGATRKGDTIMTNVTESGELAQLDARLLMMTTMATKRVVPRRGLYSRTVVDVLITVCDLSPAVIA